MAMIRPKWTFAVIVTLGMISIMFFRERINYNHYISKLMDTQTSSEKDLINGKTNDYTFPLLKDNNSYNIHNVNVFNISSKLIKNNTSSASVSSFGTSQNTTIIETIDVNQKMIDKINEIDDYLKSVRIFKPSDTKMIYNDQVMDIIKMPIDHRCTEDYGASLTVVIIVICKANGFERRKILRDTWGRDVKRYNNSVKLYFATAMADDTINRQLYDEDITYGDILQWGFTDNYYNLTLKSIGILRWTSLQCSRSKYMYKMDDDVILNIEELLRFCHTAKDNTIYGHLWKNAVVERNKNGKFFISKSDYSNDHYPNYTGGPWLIKTYLVPLLYETAIKKSLPALPYEDVYITGVVASKLKINCEFLPGLVVFSPTVLKKLDYCWYNKTIIFWQNIDENTLIKGWKQIQNTRKKGCKMP